MVTFTRLTEATIEAANDIARLLPQLSSRTIQFGLAELTAMLRQERCECYVATDGQRIVGMLTLVGYVIPTGEKWQLEDVVLDESLRGKGIARRFLTWVIAEFRHGHPAVPVYLTSRPSRVAANALYRSLGFKSKETNNYKF